MEFLEPPVVIIYFSKHVNACVVLKRSMIYLKQNKNNVLNLFKKKVGIWERVFLCDNKEVVIVFSCYLLKRYEFSFV